MKMIGSLVLAGLLLSAPVALTPASATDTMSASDAACGPCCEPCDACPCGTDCAP